MAERLGILTLRPTRVIDWWSHAGAGVALLRQQYPQAELVVVEPVATLDTRQAASAPWWRQLGQRLAGRQAATPVGDDLAPVPGQLLWSNMMLHWCTDLRALLAQWHAALEVDGMLMFSCLGPDTLGALRRAHQAQGWGEATCSFIDMHDLGDALVGAGFAEPVMDMEKLTLTWDSAASLLAELRGLGGNTAPDRHPGLRTPRWRQRLDEVLTTQLRGPDGRLRLEFEIVYGHAVRPATRAPVKANTEISLQTMREMTRNRGGRATP
jgi:malonyl-CoA O-methyltransferase